jgi:transketolase
MNSKLQHISNQIRTKLVEISHKTKTAHLASALSCVDILVALYWEVMNVHPDNAFDTNRDRFVLSKGHAAPALFTTLAFKGFFPEEWLSTYAQEDSNLEEHPAPACVPGVDIATGSLGHGLSFALGMALSAKIKKEPQHHYILMGDGEINEGSVWEAAMLAPAKNLDNVTAIIDFNKWQATDRSCDVMSLQSIQQKWEAFGWNATTIDGHDISGLIEVLKKGSKSAGKPTAIVAETVKAKGISFMEDDNNWHYRIPTADEVEKAKKELRIEN